MIYKCKMCGGDVDINENESIATCQYCNSKQTISDLNSGEIARMYYRATALRQRYEFNQAISIYNDIAGMQSKSPEPYWGILLCKYGIEYVDDPKTSKKVPVFTKVVFDNIENDFDAATVLMYSSGEAKKLYEEQLAEIESIRKRIVSVMSKGDKYDIFICYKATDENGDRTKESVIGHDYYELLTNKGYKVFFAEVTLDNKLGIDYEPYIYNALESSKLMLVIGSSQDNMKSVWVRNEWGRYLSMMANEKGDKSIIPCYTNMDAYDLPDEFSNFQALNVDKIGSSQNLLDGVDKILPLKNEKNVIDIKAVQKEINNTIKSENRKRTLIMGVVFGIIGVFIAVGIFVGVKALIKMIENNKSETTKYIYESKQDTDGFSKSNYDDGVKAFNEGHYQSASDFFGKCDDGYLDTHDYKTLCEAYRKKDVKTIANLIYKIPEAENMIWNSYTLKLDYKFMKGYWASIEGFSFQIDDNGYFWYNLPIPPSLPDADHATIDGNTYCWLVDGTKKTAGKSYPLCAFKIIDYNHVDAFCYGDNMTYALERKS